MMRRKEDTNLITSSLLSQTMERFVTELYTLDHNETPYMYIYPGKIIIFPGLRLTAKHAILK